MTILAFIFGVVITFLALRVVAHYKDTQPQNKVHFYVARDRNKSLWLYIGKPIRKEESGHFTPKTHSSTVSNMFDFKNFGLNIDDYKDLKWEDEPVEVFLNLED